MWGKVEKILSLLQPLLLLFISSPLCVLATKRELRGFWRSETGTLKREILDVTPTPHPLIPHSMSVFTHCSPKPASLYSPICFFSCLTSLLDPDVDGVFISPPGVLPSCLHPSIALCPSFLLLFLLFLALLPVGLSNICVVQARVADMSSQCRHRRSLQPAPLLVLHAMK